MPPDMYMLKLFFMESAAVSAALAVFYFVYFLLGYVDSLTWKDFKNFYKEIFSALYACIADFFKRHKKEFTAVFLFCLKLIRKFICEFRDYLNGDDTKDYIINTSFVLVEEDTAELLQSLSGRPYDTPSFYGCMQASGIARYEYRAFGLAEKYSGLDFEGTAKICLHQIRNHFMKTRRMQPYVVIEAASPARLLFAVALSEHGRNLLEQQRDAFPCETRRPAAVLEEEVSDSEEDEACR